MSDDQTTLIKIINDLENMDEKQIFDLVTKLCLRKNTSIEYAGLTYCQLSSKTIGDLSTMKLDIEPQRSIVVLKDELKQLIEKHCFINGVFEQSFKIISKINILDQQNKELPSLEITDLILQEVYGKEGYQQIMTKIDQQTKQINNYSNKDIDVKFECPIMKKTYFTFLEGINLQGQFYSVEGAIQLLQRHPDKFFPHQIEYLEKIKKQDLNQNQIDSVIFICPKTQKQYYKSFEGINIQQKLYSIEGLQQIIEKPDEQLNIDKDQKEHKYLKKIKKFQMNQY